MKSTKMNLVTMKGKLSKAEMKQIMAGQGNPTGCKGILVCNPDGPTGCAAEGANCECKKSGDDYLCL